MIKAWELKSFKILHLFLRYFQENCKHINSSQSILSEASKAFKTSAGCILRRSTSKLNQFSTEALKNDETCYSMKLFICILYPIMHFLYCRIIIRITDACLVHSLAEQNIKKLDVVNTLLSCFMQKKSSVIPPH